MSTSIPLQHSRLDDGHFCLEAECFVPLPRETVFEFFQDAHNLEELTPPFLRFNVLTPRPIAMGSGTLIDYRLRLRGLPFRWRTEILDWNPPHSFVDNQVRGPYLRWHHTHEFHEVNGGTRCTDRVLYRVLGGALIQRLFVQGDVERIFQYRQARLQELLVPPSAPGKSEMEKNL